MSSGIAPPVEPPPADPASDANGAPRVDGAPGERPPPASLPELKYLLGGLGALQAVIVAVGASNGALVAIAINNLPMLVVGTGLVVLAVVIGVFISIEAPKGNVGRSLLIVGLGALLAGLVITGYIALRGPSVAKSPDLNVTLSGDSGHYDLAGEVTVSGIPENAHYWVEVDARQYELNNATGSYVTLGTPLYQAQLGADSQGNIDEKFALPLAATQYKVVSVEAWFGDHAGPCGSLTVPGGASLTQVSPRTVEATRTAAGRAAAKAEAKTMAKTGNPAEAEAAARETLLAQTSRPGCVVVRLP
jgi:hypothetical protein